MTLNVTLIQGGGAGLDQVPAVKQVLAAVGVPIVWEEFQAGWAALERGGKEGLPPEMLDSIRRTRLALKTTLLPTPGFEGKPGAAGRNFNVQLRRELGLFATIRPVKNLSGLPARFSDVDMVILREITEDLYAAIEHEIVPGVVQSIKVVTRTACERFLRFAFEYARAEKRKSIACVHKANILKLADGLFLEAFRTIAADYPEFRTRELIVDNTCMQMVSKPQQFDMLVMGNLYGDLVSDLAAGIVGGASASHGINVGDHLRVYECFHGGDPGAIAPGKANPLPLLLPATDMLHFHGHAEAAERILDAIGRVLLKREHLTPDLGGEATTAQMAGAIAAMLK